MSRTPTYKMKFKRRRELRTDYKKRLALLKSGKARFVVRKSSNSAIAEVVVYRPEGDMVKASFTSSSLRKLGWKGHSGNLPSAYLAGYACAKKALRQGVKQAVLDIGLISPVHGSVPFAALKGALDAGLAVPADAGVFPSQERCMGRHISDETARNFSEVKSAIERELG